MSFRLVSAGEKRAVKATCPSALSMAPGCGVLGAQRRPLTEEADGSGAGASQEGSAYRISKPFVGCSRKHPNAIPRFSPLVPLELYRSAARRTAAFVYPPES